jgi:hypothetical protein
MRFTIFKARGHAVKLRGWTTQSEAAASQCIQLVKGHPHARRLCQNFFE